jgi:hypothetical protein
MIQIEHRVSPKKSIPILHTTEKMLGIELSLLSRGRMALGVGEIFWFIFHTLPQ